VSVRADRTLPQDTEDVTSLALTPSDTHVIIASRSLAVRIFAVDFSQEEVTATLVRSLPRAHDAPVAVLSVDPTSTLLATGAADGAVKVWDIAGGFCTHVFRGHGGVVSALKWNMPSPESEQAAAKGKGKGPQASSSERRIELFTGSIDGRVRLWDLRQRPASGAHKPAAVLAAHVSVVRALALSADGRSLVTGARDRTLVFWRRKGDASGSRQASTGGWEMVETLTAGEGIEAAGFLEPGCSLGRREDAAAQDLFWTGGSEGEVRLWSLAQHNVVVQQPGGRWALGLCGKGAAALATDDAAPDEARAVIECHYVPALDVVVSVHADQNLIFHAVPNPVSRPRAGRRPLSRTLQLVGFNDEVVDLALLSPRATSSKEAPQETHLAVATNSSSIRVYTLEGDSQHVELLPSDAAASSGHSALVLCLDKTYDGKWLASGAKDRTARVWAWCPKRQQASAASTSAAADLGTIVTDSELAASSETAEGEWLCVAVAEGHAESVGAVAFARRPAAPGAVGAPFLVTASQDRTAKVWDLSVLAQYLEKDPSPAVPLKLRSLTTLKIHDKDVNALDVSPNNALLLSGSQDRTAKVWALGYAAPSKSNSNTASASLKPLATCTAHKRGVWAVRFSPADAAFVTASADRTARLWSLKDFACVKTFEGHTNGVLRAEFLGARGMQLVTSGSDGLVKLWNVRDEQCVDTMDGHDARVWGLAPRSDGTEIISAGADSVMSFWEDRTVEDEVEKARDRETAVER
jgi:U3 small nucleolar RNA-associated protein 13